jgi:hypothetical protein
MANPFEQLIALVWNRTMARPTHRDSHDGIVLGFVVSDGRISAKRVCVTHQKRTEHTAGWGKTGTGKTSLERFMCQQDIWAGRPFFHIDIHGDTFPSLMSSFAAEEARRHTDVSRNLIVIDLTDPECSVGMNILESTGEQDRFVRISEIIAILQKYWEHEIGGARTQEFMRNLLLVGSYNNLTLVDVPHLATNAALRSVCMKRVQNAEVRSFFETRYDQLSEAMQNVYREAVINKLTAFSADPHFRHILGQSRSTFSFSGAMDAGCSILVNAPKGQLGENVTVLASFLLSRLTRDIFTRKTRQLFSLYLDEGQNLVAFNTGLETLFSEARKFGVGAVIFNQYLDQYPPQMRSAILAVGTHILFQVSSADAEVMSRALDGGKPLAELLRNLPKRQMVVKSGHHRFVHAAVPEVRDPQADYRDLYNRCRARWTRKRADVEQEILARQSIAHGQSQQEVLDGWR